MKSVEVDGTLRYNIFDASGVLVQVYTPATNTRPNNTRVDYIPGPAGPLARIKSVGQSADEITYLHTDHQGTARAGTDEAGALLWEDFHTPFGDSLIAPAANDNQGDYTGHIRDTGSGLTYMQARYYDPVIGRFLSIDPVTFMSGGGNPGYFNRYAYTFNDPINAIDPDGAKVVPVGTPSEVRQLNSALKLIGDSNSKSGARLQSLRSSKNIHTIRFPRMTSKGMEGPSSRSTGVINPKTGKVDNVSNGVGTGSETIVDPTQSLGSTNPDGTQVVSSGATVVTHELLGHGGDFDNGRIADTGDPVADNDADHASAVAAEHEFADAIGETKRELD